MAQLTDQAPTTDQSAGCLGVLLRLFWMLGGVPILIFLGIGIISKPNKALLIAFYWIAMIAIIMARLVDIRIFRGDTTDGKPATMKHWRRQSAIYFAASIVFFLVLLLLRIL